MNNFCRGKMERCFEFVVYVVVVDVYASSVIFLCECVGCFFCIFYVIELIERVFDVYVYCFVVIVVIVVRFVDDEVYGRSRARRVLRRAMFFLLFVVFLVWLICIVVVIFVVIVFNFSGVIVVGFIWCVWGW